MGKNDQHYDMTPRERALAFIAYLQLEIPGSSIHFKDDPPHTIPWRDRMMHALARLVVPEYRTRFTTVIYPRIYFPAGTRTHFESHPERYYATLRHEFVHLKDFQRFHLWMALSYGVLLPMFWTMRAFWEMRGYAQNMICAFENTGEVPEEMIKRMVRIFSGRSYMFMLVPASLARRQLEALRARVISGQLAGIYPYGKLNNPPPPGI